jgi:hypothetical protein
MSHSNPDYAAEERIKAKLTEAGVRDAAFDEFITETRDGYFDENSLKAWLAKRREDRPHRFVDNGEQIDPALIARAAAGNMTARSQLFVKLGKDQAAVDQLLATERAKAKAAQNAPDSKSTNPWNPTSYGGLAPDGRFSAKQISRQAECVRALGLAKAMQLAAIHGAAVGSVRPPKRAA